MRAFIVACVAAIVFRCSRALFGWSGLAADGRPSLQLFDERPTLSRGSAKEH